MEERPYRLLLVVALLAALLPAAAANFTPQQPGGPCDTAILANHIRSFCAPYTPRDGQCCETVVTSVDAGGGAACLCRVAAETQIVMAGLNETDLVALYKSCRGRVAGADHIVATKASGTSAGRPKSFKKKQIEKEVYERREESIEEEDEEEVEKTEKHKGTAGLIEIDNPNLVKPKSIKAKYADVDRTAGLSRHEREELEKQRSLLHYKKLREEGKTDQARTDLAAGTSAGRPKSFKKKQVEKGVYERREESIEEEDEEEVEKTEKHKGTAGLIEIDNPNLVKPKSIKAKDVDVDRTAGLSRREREELEKQRSILHYKKLEEEGKTDQARKDLDRLAQIRQERAVAAKKREEEKAGCNASELALSIANECLHNFTSGAGGCCSVILPTVDIENCLCMVADEPEIIGAGISSQSLFRLYIHCGGKRRAKDNLPQYCDDTSEGMTPTSPPPPDVDTRNLGKEPFDGAKRLSGLQIATDVGTWVLVFAVFCTVVGGAIYWWRTGHCLQRAVPPASPKPRSTGITARSSAGEGSTTNIAPSETDQPTSNALATDGLNCPQININPELAITVTG